MAVLRPFFPYFGAKWRAAGHVPAPLHSVLIEPFAGSACYALRHHQRQVRLYDLDPVISGIWDYLIRTPSSDLPLEAEVDSLRVCQEARWLIGFWLNKGVAYPCQRWSRWGHKPAYRTGCNFWGQGVRERIVRQQPSIRHWTVCNLSYDQIPRLPATWYIDPPYQDKGSAYRMSADQLDFAHLGSWCQSLPGQVMVCEQSGADWLPFEEFGEIKSTKGKSSEVMWLNGAGKAQQKLFL